MESIKELYYKLRDGNHQRAVKNELTISFNFITGNSVKFRMVKKRIYLVYGKEQYLFKMYCNKNATVYRKSTLNLGCEKKY